MEKARRHIRLSMMIIYFTLYFFLCLIFILYILQYVFLNFKPQNVHAFSLQPHFDSAKNPYCKAYLHSTDLLPKILS